MTPPGHDSFSGAIPRRLVPASALPAGASHHRTVGERFLALFVGEDKEAITPEAGRCVCRRRCSAALEQRRKVMKASLIVGLALAAAASMSLAASLPAYGQKPPKPAVANFKAPYNSFGQPDISG